MYSEKKINTTINFMEERLELVFDTSKKYGISYKKIIKRCIDCFIIDFNKKGFKESALKYQEDHNKWKKVHFAMLPHEYDVYFDLKKVSRCSFSLIVAMAIDMYLHSVVNQYQENSYPTDTYEKLCILEGNYPIYLFTWKKTEKTEKIHEILRE
jgi:hypothetical protein